MKLLLLDDAIKDTPRWLTNEVTGLQRWVVTASIVSIKHTSTHAYTTSACVGLTTRIHGKVFSVYTEPVQSNLYHSWTQDRLQHRQISKVKYTHPSWTPQSITETQTNICKQDEIHTFFLNSRLRENSLSLAHRILGNTRKRSNFTDRRDYVFQGAERQVFG